MTTVLPILNMEQSRPAGWEDATGPRHISSVQTLRISVTDRCNFRCVYCMPHDALDWAPRDTLLSYEEIVQVVRASVRLGIQDFKITGGEPLVRNDVTRLVEMLRAEAGVRDLSMTTNGALLDRYAAGLRHAGLDRITVSIDSLRADRFAAITRGGDLAAVHRGINAASHAGFDHPKINVVAMKGVNDDEFADLAAWTLAKRLTIRFIEFMPLGEAYYGETYDERFIPEAEIRAIIESRFGTLELAAADTGSGPARVYRIRGAAGLLGFISAMSKPFCATCNRLRLTAEGQLRSCLFDGGEVELRPILRGALHPRDCTARLRDAFVDCVRFKPDLHRAQGNRQMSQIGG